jgi:hypothetical protein
MEQTEQRSGIVDLLTTGPLRVAVSFVVPVVAFLALRWSFIFMRDSEAPKLVIGAVALIVGAAGIWIIYIITNDLVSRLPEGIRERVRPFVFVGPALVILAAYVVFPAINTLYLSFLDAKSEDFVGLENFIFALTDPKMLNVLRNNVLWLIFVTSFAVGLGLLIAVMADRVGGWEPVAKSVIFLPMAISAVGASVIWKFVYSFQPPGRSQIGLLMEQLLPDRRHDLAADRFLHGGPVCCGEERAWRTVRSGPHRRRKRSKDILLGHHSLHPGNAAYHHHHRVDHGDQSL